MLRIKACATAEFQPGQPSIGFYLVLQYLMEKYTTLTWIYMQHSLILTQFLIISGIRLWDFMSRCSIGKRLLLPIHKLYDKNNLRVRFNWEGDVSDFIQTVKWVKQRCILALLPFNILYISTLQLKSFRQLMSIFLN